MKHKYFFIDTLKILPLDTYCSFQAPNLENQSILKIVNRIHSDFSKVIYLSLLNKMSLISVIESDSEIIQSFHYIEINSIQNKKLFEAWDGVEFGYFSKDMEIPDWFKEKHFNFEMYHVCEDW